MSALFGMTVCCVCVCVCICLCVCMCVGVYGFFVIEVSSSFFFFFFLYCLLQAVKIHIEDHSVSSRVILCMEGWMAGWTMERVGVSRRPLGEGGGGGQVATVGGAPLKIPIDWLINQKALKAS